MTHYVYRSPLEPLDFDAVVEDFIAHDVPGALWAMTQYPGGEWTPHTEYTLLSPLSDEFVAEHGLRFTKTA